MKKNFKLEITYEVEIREGEFKGSDDRRKVFIDKFISEFVKDRKAIYEYFKENIITLLTRGMGIPDELPDILDIYEPDSIFLEVADRCSPEVKNLIYGLMVLDYIPKLPVDEHNEYQDIFDSRFKPIKIIDASFKEMGQH